MRSEKRGFGHCEVIKGNKLKVKIHSGKKILSYGNKIFDNA